MANKRKNRQKTQQRKTEENIRKLKSDKIRSMSIEIGKICNELVAPTKEFDNKRVKSHIEEYISKYDRFLYSIISQYIFELEEEEKGIFITNLGALLDDVLDSSSPSANGSIKTKKEDQILNCILKLWDHVNLAVNQHDNLRQTEEEFEQRFTRSIIPVKETINNQLNSMNAQLISLIGIFTAMSFLVFGGISSLDNIFDGAVTIPITKLMIIGCIWGLCIINLIFIFMFFVAKMTNLNIKSNLNEEANIFQRYPLVWWSNLLIGTILTGCIWIFYIDKVNLGGFFINLTRNIKGVEVIGAIVIFCIFMLGARFLYNQTQVSVKGSKRKVSKEERESFANKLLKKNFTDFEI